MSEADPHRLSNKELAAAIDELSWQATRASVLGAVSTTVTLNAALKELLDAQKSRAKEPQ